MKVILTKDVDTLGESGDVINVSDGYYRNYLSPKNMAIEATNGAMRDLQSRIDRIRAKAEKKQADDQEKADKVAAIELLTIEANASETGKLFGAITTKELATVLLEKTGLEVERKQINVSVPMNHVGEYQINVKFSSKVSAVLPVVIKATVDPQKQSLIEEMDAAAEQATEEDA